MLSRLPAWPSSPSESKVICRLLSSRLLARCRMSWQAAVHEVASQDGITLLDHMATELAWPALISFGSSCSALIGFWLEAFRPWG